MNRKLFLVLFLLPIKLFANGWNAHLAAGMAWTDVNNTDNLYLNPFVENAYSTDTTTSQPLINAGIGYLWNKPFPRLPELDIDLGINNYYISYDVSGINSPFINVGQFDTLNYRVKDTSYSLFVEPKIICTHFQRLQPYVLGGVGKAWNHVSDYSESPTNPALSAAPMPIPFTGKTMRNMAYEFGFGVQTDFLKMPSNNILRIFCDYRYINWGTMQLGTTPLQTTAGGPNLGLLKTQAVNIGMEYQLA